MAYVGGTGSHGVALGPSNPAFGPGHPLHGSALAVTALLFGPAGQANGIFHVLLVRGRRGLHPDFVAVVEERGTAVGKQDGGDDALDVGVMHAVAVAGIEARIVVIVEDDQRNVVA